MRQPLPLPCSRSLGAWSLTCVLLLPAAAWADAEQDLQEGARAYERSDYARTIELIRPLLYPAIRLPQQSQVLYAYKLLGISYVFERHREEAEKQFLAILSIQPDYRLDPLVAPVAAVEFFEEVKRRNAEKIRMILERERREAESRRQAEERRKAEERRLALLARQGQNVVERTIVEHPYWINFVPLGAGQFQNGQRHKGYALMGTQLGLAALSLGTGLAAYVGYSGRPLPEEEYARARALNIVQVASAGLCAATIVYGVIDALVHYQAQTVKERRFRSVERSRYFVAPTANAGVQLGVAF